MALSALPPELRLRIYDYLPDIADRRTVAVKDPASFLPPLRRTSRQLHQETISIYAENTHFAIDTSEDSREGASLLTRWLAALGPSGVRKIRSLQLSRHWDASQPTRWQGHVGFYVRLEKGCNESCCTTGTYPVARDMRGMRLESVELLRYVVRQNVLSRASQRENQALNASDIELIVSAMVIVANHPISAFDTEQSEAGKKKRRETWVGMEEKLFELHANDRSEQDEPKRFFTPY
ncbi:hypothetical protein D0862_03299 [Hortaea werneckii]|uniref:F-box domain-containing protein n=1 Tax=Hortaea werneckii TaxID=91943 RepID=A0A3M7HBB8_HORWE|nr:hypothetical protein D0862_03299 [Hortaea werneckii]